MMLMHRFFGSACDRGNVTTHGNQAAAFHFLRQPSRPNAPRPVAKSGSAAGSGVVIVSPIINCSANKSSGVTASKMYRLAGGPLKVKLLLEVPGPMSFANPKVELILRAPPAKKAN